MRSSKKNNLYIICITIELLLRRTLQSLVFLVSNDFSFTSAKHQQSLSNYLNKTVEIINFQIVNGGSINETYKVSIESDYFFCKKNNAQKFPHLFQKEKKRIDFNC